MSEALRPLPHDALDAALQEALDARRDPLEDEAVLAALAEEPERFGEVLRLRESARALAAPSPVRPSRRSRAAAVAALVLAAAAAGVALRLARPDDRPSRGDTAGAPAVANVADVGAEADRAAPRAEVRELFLAFEPVPPGGRPTPPSRRAAHGSSLVVRSSTVTAIDGTKLEVTSQQHIR
ncbi:MAG: hypothetical protein R3F34_05105 [Planctomycetota bacterium]